MRLESYILNVDYQFYLSTVIFLLAGSQHGAETGGKESPSTVPYKKSHSVEGCQSFLCISSVE